MADVAVAVAVAGKPVTFLGAQLITDADLGFAERNKTAAGITGFCLSKTLEEHFITVKAFLVDNKPTLDELGIDWRIHPDSKPEMIKAAIDWVAEVEAQITDKNTRYAVVTAAAAIDTYLDELEEAAAPLAESDINKPKALAPKLK